MTEVEFYAELDRRLPDNYEYVRWWPADKSVDLDGGFTADELKVIVELLEKAQ